MVLTQRKYRLLVTPAALTVTLLVGLVISPVSITNSAEASDQISGVEPPANFTGTNIAEAKTQFTDPEIEYQRERANSLGISAEQVQADDLAGLQLGAIATQLELEFGDLYFQSAWRQDQKPNAQIVLVGEVPDAAWRLINSAPFEIETIVTEGPTRSESADVVEIITKDLRAQGKVSVITGSYDPIEGSYALTYYGEQLERAEVVTARSSAVDQPVQITYGGAEVSGGPQFFGGNPIGGSQCTAGFVVWNKQSTYGIATAGHCPNLNGNFNYIDGFFSNGGTVSKDYGDVRWGWASSGTINRAFRETATSLKAVTAVTTPFIGQGHCTYGQSSYTSCATVSNINMNISWPGYGTWKRMACDSTVHTLNGDSGGPVFGGNTAIGFTAGVYPIYGINKSCFSTVTGLYAGAYVDIAR